jgi:hypothetical protein
MLFVSFPLVAQPRQAESTAIAWRGFSRGSQNVVYLSPTRST